MNIKLVFNLFVLLSPFVPALAMESGEQEPECFRVLAKLEAAADPLPAERHRGPFEQRVNFTVLMHKFEVTRPKKGDREVSELRLPQPVCDMACSGVTGSLVDFYFLTHFGEPNNRF